MNVIVTASPVQLDLNPGSATQRLVRQAKSDAQRGLSPQPWAFGVASFRTRPRLKGLVLLNLVSQPLP
jgi:hypothetical protein